MILSAILILGLGVVMKMTGKPWVYGLVYFGILMAIGMANGNALGTQLYKSAIFSVFPAIAFFLLNWKKSSVVAWILIIGGAVVMNDLLIIAFEEMAAK